MNEVRIASRVEGDGEIQAVPVLLRRIVPIIDPLLTLVVPPAFRHPSGSIRKEGGIEKAIDAMAALYPGHSIFVLIDSDDDCPHDLGPQLASRAKSARAVLHISVVLAHREFESWFLARSFRKLWKEVEQIVRRWTSG